MSSGVEFLEGRVSASEEDFKDFNQTNSTVNHAGLGVGVATEQSIRNEGLSEEENILCKLELMGANGDQQGNNGGINPQGTSDKTAILEISSAQRQNEDEEDASSKKGGWGTDVQENHVILQTTEKGEMEHRSNSSKEECAEENKRSPSKKSASSLELQSSAAKNKGVKSKAQFKCPQCPKLLRWQSMLKSHILSHSGERPFSCPYCPHSTSLAENMRRHHPAENQNLLQCKICQEEFPSRKSLTAHMGKHLVCYFCSVKFKRFCEMRGHLSIHTGEKPFNCPHCRFSTIWQSSLRGHIRAIHENATL